MAVVFRRGPSRWVQLSLWDTANDAFAFGQWFHGRIYWESSDVSPDGTMLIYFAAKFERAATGEMYSWTAVSKPPFLTALALWKGCGTYGGGGLFESNSRLRLDTGSLEPTKGELPRDLKVEGRSWLEYGLIYSRRLELGGWMPHQSARHSASFYKQNPSGRFALLQQWNKADFHRLLKYGLTDLKGGYRPSLDQVEWADWDYRGRLVFARNGRLWAANEPERLKQDATMILDFNDLKPEERAAPEWARRW